MDLFAVVIAVTLVVGVAAPMAMGFYARRAPRRMLATRTRRTLLVHRVGMPSIRGVLVEEALDGLVLRRASYLAEPNRPGDPAPPPVVLDGDALVPWATVDCVQDISATAALVDHRPATRLTRSPFDAASSDPRPLRKVD